MIWITGICGFCILVLLLILHYERRKYKTIINYLETYGDRSCILYNTPTGINRDSAVIRDISGEIHRINTSEIVLIGKLHNSDTYEFIFKGNQIIRINGRS